MWIIKLALLAIGVTVGALSANPADFPARANSGDAASSTAVASRM
jgi:hypothetical protein